MTHLNSFTIIAQLAVLSASLIVVYGRLVGALHMLQQEGYSNARYIRWLFRSRWRAFDLPALVLLVAFAVVAIGMRNIGDGLLLVLAVASAVGLGALAYRRWATREVKKPLKVTGRVLRILSLSLFLCAASLVAFAWITFGGLSISSRASALGRAALAAAVIVEVSPLVVVFANVLLWPLQFGINSLYIRRAKQKLVGTRAVVVGITGSYGKTSTKYFTEFLLNSKYRVLKTPGSYNTLLGICRVINEELGPEHDVFVVEMGAYRPGDIEELAKLTRPRIGVLTAIGPQHLERFGSIERIEKTKYELVAALPAEGVAVINNDDPRCRRLADMTTHVAVRRYGMDGDEALDIRATDVRHGATGLSFTLSNAKGERHDVTTRLLGRHNVLNILAAAAVAQELGVRFPVIAKRISELQPVPHRLQMSQVSDTMVVIDDSYNSNPVGAMGALDVLADFAGYSRVLITPGMIELGSEEDAWNERFGAAAARAADYVILMGPRQTAAIRRGLDSAGFPSECIQTANSIKEALSLVEQRVRGKAVVLFENDLPDIYLDR